MICLAEVMRNGLRARLAGCEAMGNGDSLRNELTYAAVINQRTVEPILLSIDTPAIYLLLLLEISLFVQRQSNQVLSPLFLTFELFQ